MSEPLPQPNKPVVLCVDDDRDIAEVVEAIPVDEASDVSCLFTLDVNALHRAVGRLEPDCVAARRPSKPSTWGRPTWARWT